MFIVLNTYFTIHCGYTWAILFQTYFCFVTLKFVNACFVILYETFRTGQKNSGLKRLIGFMMSIFSEYDYSRNRGVC